MRQQSLLFAFALLVLTLTFNAIAQEKEPPTYRVRVRVVKHAWDDMAIVQPYVLSQNQAEWWNKTGKKRFPGVCFVSTEQEADYLLTWAETTTTQRLTLIVPTTATHSETVTTDDGRSATYGGTSATMGPGQEDYSKWWIQLRVYKLSAGKPEPAPLISERIPNRWMWSKSDKDAFEKALKALSDQKL